MKYELKSGDSHGYGINNYSGEFQLKLINAGVIKENYRYYIDISSLDDLVNFLANIKQPRLAIDIKDKIIFLNFSTEITSNY